VGLIAAGVFRTDPACGFPQGASAGLPNSFSWQAILRGIAASMALLLAAACFVFVRRFAARRSRGWVAYYVATGVAVPVLGFPAGSGVSVRLAIATLLAFGWATAITARLKTKLAYA
jgi:hypothetical protein